MLNRRDVLTLSTAAATAASVTSALAANPFDNPTARFSAPQQQVLPAWAFSLPLNIPPTPRPTTVGQFDQVDGKKYAFGADDPAAVGEVFHGVALEWGATPPHWTLYDFPSQSAGLPSSSDSWKHKQKHFGDIALHDQSGSIHNWGGFPIKCYKVHIESKLLQLIPDLPRTRIFGYGGLTPGPTFKFRHGQPVVIRYQNHLENEVSVHLHGAHTPSHSDGFPTFYVLQGKSRDYFYPNFVPLKLQKENGAWVPDYSEAQSTMWYHDHGMDATGFNVSKGLAGFALFYSEEELKLIANNTLPGLGKLSCIDPELDGRVDDADLEDPQRPGYYRYGKEPYHNPYDLPLVLQDKVIDQRTGQIAFDTNAHNGYLGDTFFVNGVPWPFVKAENRKYRLRVLNGSNARIYRLRLLSEEDYLLSQQSGLSDAELRDKAKRFLRIGKDSWLWEKAVGLQDVVLAMANRADLVIDFPALKEAAGLKENETARFYLVNTMPQTDGRGPKQELQDPGDPRVFPLPFELDDLTLPELSKPIALMRFDVTGAPVEGDARVVADTPLIKREPIAPDDVKVVREFVFGRGKGAWQVNNRFYDPTISNASPTLHTAEEWILRNEGGGWWHPIHIHLESHQIIQYLKDFGADEVIDLREPPDPNRLNDLTDVTKALGDAHLTAYHDTQVLGPNTVVRIRIRMRTFNGPFVFHCHNLEHEDMRMMFNFELKPLMANSPSGEHVETDVIAANTIPDARTHGNVVTLNGRKHGAEEGRIGELPWEFAPIPFSKTVDADENVIPPFEANP